MLCYKRRNASPPLERYEMKIAAGIEFYKQFGDRVAALCPTASWILFDSKRNWLGSPNDAQLAVLVGDAYCNQFKDAMLKAPSLRWLHTENSGVDGEFYKNILSKKIFLTRSPGANAPEVAEFVFALILQQIKKLKELQRQHLNRDWHRLPLESLADKTLLVIGLGEVGGRVAKIAKVFGLYVLGIRKQKEFMEGVDEIGSLSNLPDFIPRADIVVLALALSPATVNMFGADQFRLMKDGAMFINVARGQIVDMRALYEAIKIRPDIQICLDVMPEEPWPTNDCLWAAPNVFITPHLAWSSPLYRPRAAQLWLDNLSRFLRGLPLRNQVLPESASLND